MVDGAGPCSLFEDAVTQKMIEMQEALEALIQCLEEHPDPETPPMAPQSTSQMMAEDPSKPIHRQYYEAKARMLVNSVKEFRGLIKAKKI